MQGKVGQEWQDQVGVVSTCRVKVVGKGVFGVDEGTMQHRRLVGGQDVDRRHPPVVPVVGHLVIGQNRHGPGR